MKIGITGAAGLLGWHLRAFLQGQPDVQIALAGRETFTSSERLQEFVRGLDAVVHLAGMNRGEDQEIYETNLVLTKALISACEATHARPHIVFSSSTHIARDTSYGRSKRECAELLRAWESRSEGRFTNFILPNVFGEGGRPFYNSAVSTFCYQLANKEEPKIIQDAEIELVHTQQVAAAMWKAIHTLQPAEIRLYGVKIQVSEVLAKLRALSELYAQQVTPDLRGPFDLDLFNTYRSYLYPQAYPIAVTVRTDTRGRLFETMRSLNGGQSFVSSTKPGVTRGDHYHLHKYERFFVLSGDAVIRIRRVFSDKVDEFVVSGDRPAYIDIPTLHAHNITNTKNSELLTFFWSHQLFDPNNADTIPEVV